MVCRMEQEFHPMRLSPSGTSRCCGSTIFAILRDRLRGEFPWPRDRSKGLRHYPKAITCFDTDGQLNRTISSERIAWLSSTTSCIGWECLKWNRHRYQFARSRACVRRLHQGPQPVGAEMSNSTRPPAKGISGPLRARN